jgi:3-hydroxyacyl-[acyl-carrier-protein] dehydratase
MSDETTEILPSSDIVDIQRRIPHRYPFLFVDHVRDIKINESAVGIKNVTFNEPHFQGHFPAKPVMPGVTIVEAMAQTSAILTSHSLDMLDKEFLVYFMTLDNCRFRRPVGPGDVLELHVDVVRKGSRIWKFHGRGMVDGALASEADFSAMLSITKT